MSTVTTARLGRARALVADLERRVEQARARSAAVTPGGGDPGSLSGVRRRPNRRMDVRRFSAYDREADLTRALTRARADLQRLESTAARQSAEAAARATVDPSEVVAGRMVRTRHGWHRVVRVNAKSLTVATPYSWTERIPLHAVLEVRP